MELVSACPLPVASLLWQPRPGASCLTVVCKATFLLEPHEARLAPEQEPIHESDLAPAKPRADVVLVGRAYAPGGNPGRSLVARLAVGEIDKSVEVFGDRPVGFGPMPPGSPLRRERLGRFGALGDVRAFQQQPMPEGFDLGYFNVAPADQQLAGISDEALITLENLHPDHAHLVTRLPGRVPTAIIEGPERTRAMVPLRCDTLWIDTDRALCALTFRGLVLLSRADEPGQIVVRLEEEEELEPIIETARAPWPEDEPPAPPPTKELAKVQTVAAGLVSAGPALPFARAHAAPAPTPTPPQPTTPVPPPPPALIAAAPPARFQATPPAAAPPPPMFQAPPPLVHAPAVDGLLAASNAAAPPKPVEPEPRRPSPKPAPARPAPWLDDGDVLQLLWYAPESMPRIRRRKAWKAILDEIEEEPIDPELDDPDLSASPADVENRRDLTAILARGEPAGPEALREALADGIRNGALTPRIALVTGELVFPWDELTMLRALVIAVTPLAAEDERLRPAARAAGDFLAIPGLFSAPAVAEGLAGRIKDALRQGRRAAAEVIEAQAERAVLEQRGYQRRLVFGGQHLRATLGAPGGQAAAPVYLPERLAPELPLYQRFRARLLAEVHPPVDQQEPYPVALRAVALARVITRERAR